jgi:hypothetical protein
MHEAYAPAGPNHPIIWLEDTKKLPHTSSSLIPLPLSLLILFVIPEKPALSEVG